MTEGEIKHIASEAAKEAVKEVLEVLGLDVTTSAARLEVQRDFAHLRTLRLTGAMLANKILAAIAGAAGMGIASALAFYVLHRGA